MSLWATRETIARSTTECLLQPEQISLSSMARFTGRPGKTAVAGSARAAAAGSLGDGAFAPPRSCSGPLGIGLLPGADRLDGFVLGTVAQGDVSDLRWPRLDVAHLVGDGTSRPIQALSDLGGSTAGPGQRVLPQHRRLLAPGRRCAGSCSCCTPGGRQQYAVQPGTPGECSADFRGGCSASRGSGTGRPGLGRPSGSLPSRTAGSHRLSRARSPSGPRSRCRPDGLPAARTAPWIAAMAPMAT